MTPACATLFDFGTPQKNDLRFFYVLPFSKTQALVEYTIFSSQLLPEEEYEAALREYIHDRLGVISYQIHSEEYASIPMTDYPFPAARGRAHHDHRRQRRPGKTFHRLCLQAYAARCPGNCGLTGEPWSPVQWTAIAFTLSFLRYPAASDPLPPGANDETHLPEAVRPQPDHASLPFSRRRRFHPPGPGPDRLPAPRTIPKSFDQRLFTQKI